LFIFQALVTYFWKLSFDDLWRLLVMYYHGGYYQDVDRPSAPNLDELLASVRMCLPISGTRRNYGNFEQESCVLDAATPP
jgi:mannosyltransferase OCH1-like enzyme